MTTAPTTDTSSTPFPASGTPPPPYYAVVFTSVRKPVAEGYASTAQRMVDLAHEQDGFHGTESVSSASTAGHADGSQDSDEGVRGITVSYWQDLESIEAWKRNGEHVLARAKGRKEWYERFEVRVCKVERAFRFGE